MTTGITAIKCAAMDPVYCPTLVRGLGTRDAAQKLLTHLNNYHVHHPSEPGWGLTFTNEHGVEVHIGESYA